MARCGPHQPLLTACVATSNHFGQADIDEILESNSTRVSYDQVARPPRSMQATPGPAHSHDAAPQPKGRLERMRAKPTCIILNHESPSNLNGATTLTQRPGFCQSDSSGSVFSRAAFVADDNAVDMDDPLFWTKILPELQQKDAELAEYFLKRKSKQARAPTSPACQTLQLN